MRMRADSLFQRQLPYIYEVKSQPGTGFKRLIKVAISLRNGALSVVECQNELELGPILDCGTDAASFIRK